MITIADVRERVLRIVFGLAVGAAFTILAWLIITILGG